MGQKYTGEERRKWPRINANFVVSYRIQETPDDYDLSQTKDIGQGGVLITTNKPFNTGAHLTMLLRIPFVPQKIEITGEVVASTEMVRDLIYETRVKFLSLNSDFFEKLGEFIKENIK